MLAIGFQFMLIGMAVVVLFLTLLVIVLKIVGGILKGLPAEDSAQPGSIGGAEQEIAIALAVVSSYKDSSR